MSESERIESKKESECPQKETEDSIVSNNKENKEAQEEKSFIGYYFSGLKYGIVFGLAIVIGFSIVQNLKENQQKDTNEIKAEPIIASDTAEIASDTLSK